MAYGQRIYGRAEMYREDLGRKDALGAYVLCCAERCVMSEFEGRDEWVANPFFRMAIFGWILFLFVFGFCFRSAGGRSFLSSLFPKGIGRKGKLLNKTTGLPGIRDIVNEKCPWCSKLGNDVWKRIVCLFEFNTNVENSFVILTRHFTITLRRKINRKLLIQSIDQTNWVFLSLTGNLHFWNMLWNLNRHRKLYECWCT